MQFTFASTALAMSALFHLSLALPLTEQERDKSIAFSDSTAFCTEPNFRQCQNTIIQFDTCMNFVHDVPPPLVSLDDGISSFIPNQQNRCTIYEDPGCQGNEYTVDGVPGTEFPPRTQTLPEYIDKKASSYMCTHL